MVAESQNMGYEVRLHTTSEEHWRFNIAVGISSRDGADNQTGFVSHFDRVAGTVANLAERPLDVAAERTVCLAAEDSDGVVISIYVIAHTLPKSRKVTPDMQPFPLDVSVTYKGHKLYDEPLMIDRWGGANAIIRLSANKY